MLCLLYVMAVGACLAIVGWLVEACLPHSWPRRWVWCATILLSMTIPPIYRAHHRLPIDITSRAASEQSWWVRIGALDPQIMDVWGIVSVVLVLAAMLSVLRVSHLMRRAQLQREPGIIDGIPVAVTETLGPATVGVLRSRVVIPRWVLALPGTQRQYVLRHEEEHRRAHDTHMLFFSSLLIVVTPWNLPLYWQLRRLSVAVEMDCDQRVVHALGSPSTYGELLLDIAEVTSQQPRLQPNFLGRGSLERRLQQLIAPKRSSNLQRVLFPAFALLLMYLVISTPHPVTTDHVTTHAISETAKQ